VFVDDPSLNVKEFGDRVFLEASHVLLIILLLSYEYSEPGLSRKLPRNDEMETIQVRVETASYVLRNCKVYIYSV
jgi:hypothetical protein